MPVEADRMCNLTFTFGQTQLTERPKPKVENPYSAEAEHRPKVINSLHSVLNPKLKPKFSLNATCFHQTPAPLSELFFISCTTLSSAVMADFDDKSLKVLDTLSGGVFVLVWLCPFDSLRIPLDSPSATVESPSMKECHLFSLFSISSCDSWTVYLVRPSQVSASSVRPANHRRCTAAMHTSASSGCRNVTVITPSGCRYCKTQSNYIHLFTMMTVTVVLRCWLGDRKGIRPVKNWVVGCLCGCLSGARCSFAYGPADATATHYLLLQ